MEENELEKVGVIIPLHNGEEWIGDCLDSILHQTFLPFEVSVFNDHSTDNSQNIVEQFRSPFLEKNVKLIVKEVQCGGVGRHEKKMDQELIGREEEKRKRKEIRERRKEERKRGKKADSSSSSSLTSSLSSSLSASLSASSLSSSSSPPSSPSLSSSLSSSSPPPSPLSSSSPSPFSLSSPKECTCKRGAGFARNMAVQQSSADYLCFIDADDMMMPNRIEEQIKAIKEQPNGIVGSNFVRSPEGSTERYTKWLSNLTQKELYLHRFRDVTLIQSTWFMSRKTFERAGGYCEEFPLCPEDLLFFYSHLERGGSLCKVEKDLVTYRYHKSERSSSIHRLKLLKERLHFFEKEVLGNWDSFCIWGAGRDGKKFYLNLQPKNQEKVKSFHDIDTKKIGKIYTNCWTQSKVPIKSFETICPPFVTCVALDRDPLFERMVQSLGLQEGKDFWHFF